MTAAYDKLKALLNQQGTLSNDDIQSAIAEHGEMTAEEQVQLESDRHEKTRAAQETVSMDDYLAALKVLDSAAEGSEEYVKAEKTVDRYESGT